jgi:hypothetical protein
MNCYEIVKTLLHKADDLKEYEIVILNEILKIDRIDPYEMMARENFKSLKAFDYIKKYYNIRGITNCSYLQLPAFVHKDSPANLIQLGENVLSTGHLLSDREREDYRRRFEEALNTPLEPFGKIHCEKEAKECYDAFNEQYMKEKPCYFPVPFEDLTPASVAGWKAVYNHMKYGKYLK